MNFIVPVSKGALGFATTSTDNAIVRFDGTEGNTQNSVLILDDTTGALSGFATGAGITFHGGGTITGASGVLRASGNFLLGGLTTNGTGVLQFPAATTSAGGMDFGTDTHFFRVAAGRLRLTHTGGTTPRFDIAEGATLTFSLRSDATNVYLQTQNAYPLVLGVNAGTALTLDSSQNATFAGAAITAATAAAKAGLRLPHGTAPSSPVDGDMWTTTAGLYVRINGATVGPLS